MAEKQPDDGRCPEKRPVLVSSGSSSTEISSAASSDLQPFSLGRVPSSVSSPSNLSSFTVPVRLDILYFLLNSAAKGAQNALPSLPIHGGQGAFPMCPCHTMQHAVNCCHHSTCSGVPSWANLSHPVGGARHLGAPQGGWGGQGGWSVGVPGNQNSGDHSGSITHPRDGKAWPSSGQAHSASVWKRSQSIVDWKNDQKEEGSWRSNRSNGQGGRPSGERSWGDWRQGTTKSWSGQSGSKGWRREGLPFGSDSGSSRRHQEYSHQKGPWDVPEAKRHSDDVRGGWQKNQGKLELTSSLSKAVDAGPAKPPLIQLSGEDWEADYEIKQASSAAQVSVSHPAHQKSQGDPPRTSEHWESKYGPASNSAQLRPKTSPLLGSPPKDPGPSTTRKESSGTHADQSKNGGFVSYLKGLYSDLPGKPSSEGSTDLAVDTDMESSKPSEEEQPPKNAADEELKAWEQTRATGLGGRHLGEEMGGSTPELLA